MKNDERPTVTTEGVIFFSPEFCSRGYQNSGHTGGSFFFTRILFPRVPKFRTYRRVFLFHQNFVPEDTKIQDIQEGISFFHQNFEKETPYEKETHFDKEPP